MDSHHARPSFSTAFFCTISSTPFATLWMITGFSQQCNIVGYQTIDAPAAGQSVALAIQFSPVDDASTVSITNLLTVATPKASPTFAVTGDQLWKYDPATGWIKYWWRTASKNWVKSGTTAITEDTVAPGDTVLFRRGNGGAAETITFTYPAKTAE